MMRPLVVGWYGPSDGPWGWIQSQFENPILLNDKNFEDWLSEERPRDPTVSRLMIVASEHRTDRMALTWIEKNLLPPAGSTAKRASKTPVAAILGNDWHGHRRTSPLPDGLPNFYWYQWYDRIFPWVIEVLGQAAEQNRAARKSKSANDRPAESTPWRVQWLIDRSTWQATMLQRGRSHASLAWIVTDHGDGQDLWRDTCGTAGMHVVVSRLSRDPPGLEPHLIVIDCVSRSEDSERAIRGTVQAARERHPGALLAVVDPFPSWARWFEWQSLGVDVILPRPAALQGFLIYWQAWRSQVAT